MRARTHSEGRSGSQLGNRRTAWCGRAPRACAVDTHVPDAQARDNERTAFARLIGRCLQFPRSLAKTTKPLPGIVRAAELAKPCIGGPLASTMPLLPAAVGLTQLS